MSEIKENVLLRPGRLIGFAGDVTFEEAQQILSRIQLPEIKENKAFSPLLKKGGQSYWPCQKPQQATWDFFHPRVNQVHYSFARYYPGSSFLDGIKFADIKLKIAEKVLNNRLRDAFLQMGDAYQMDIYSWGPIYQIQTYTRPEQAVEFENKLRTHIEKFAKEGISETERETVLKALYGERAFRLQHPLNLLSNIFSDVKKNVTLGESYLIPEKASQISREEINEFIGVFFNPTEFIMVRLQPQKPSFDRKNIQK